MLRHKGLIISPVEERFIQLLFFLFLFLYFIFLPYPYLK